MKTKLNLPGPPSRLQIENEQLRARCEQLESAVVRRARTHMGELMDAINYTTMLARMGDKVAAADIKNLVDGLEAAKAVARLIVVEQPNGQQDGQS